MSTSYVNSCTPFTSRLWPTCVVWLQHIQDICTSHACAVNGKTSATSAARCARRSLHLAKSRLNAPSSYGLLVLVIIVGVLMFAGLVGCVLFVYKAVGKPESGTQIIAMVCSMLNIMVCSIIAIFIIH